MLALQRQLICDGLAITVLYLFIFYLGHPIKRRKKRREERKRERRREERKRKRRREERKRKRRKKGVNKFYEQHSFCQTSLKLVVSLKYSWIKRVIYTNLKLTGGSNIVKGSQDYCFWNQIKYNSDPRLSILLNNYFFLWWKFSF